MKKLLFSFLFSLILFNAFADGERVGMLINGSYVEYDPGKIKLQTPCSEVVFIVDYQIPSGYVIAAKYEWYVNGVLVKTTTQASDKGLPQKLITTSTSIYCNVTYKKSSGQLSSVQTSNTLL